jgi:iron only hydrogenase large subunit-like protein/ABC-type transporter Mla subunit MlaD
VKYCVDGSRDKVSIDSNLCIGCGNCIAACSHGARTIKDDSLEFFEALSRGEKTIAIVAPALAASFPDNWRRLLGWLKRMGVAAAFDVGFGAELTVKSYIDHVRRHSPRLVIAQPCPAIVSFIEIYHPELLPHLAPADSPMLHTIKMVKASYPEYRGYKVLVVSPCAAKKREFEETGQGDYNVTFKSFADALVARGVELSKEPEAGFDNPEAERAVVFSTPGGLMRTASRDLPGIAAGTRRIEGPSLVYPYMAELAASLEAGTNPLLVDCLNCEYGCNAGPGTLNHGKCPDGFEAAIERRRAEGERAYGGRRPSDRKNGRRLDRVLSRYWDRGRYGRNYVDRSSNFLLVQPSEAELTGIYESMGKQAEADHLNCSSCGYASCKGMAIAIFNGLNKKENCHLYRQRVIEKEREIVDGSTSRLLGEIDQASGMVGTVQELIGRLRERSASQLSALESSAASVQEMIATLTRASGLAEGKRAQIEELADESMEGERSMAATVEAIRAVSKGVSGISEMIMVIDDVADRTNLLAMNAAIQAARAGTSGKGFAVVAGEIRNLAEATSGNARRITETLGQIAERIRSSDELTERTGDGIKTISEDVSSMASEMATLLGSLGEISAGGESVNRGIDALLSVSGEVKELYDSMTAAVGEILQRIGTISKVSQEARQEVDKA